MTTAPQTALAPPASTKNSETTDPVYRQIRDLVYKTSGIYQLEEKLYLLVDSCGRRIKQLGLRSLRFRPGKIDCLGFTDEVCWAINQQTGEGQQLRTEGLQNLIVCPEGPEPPTCPRLR
jgi:hypothetical protein